MERMFSPWRSRYIESFKTPKTEEECIFCAALKGNNDKERLVIHRGSESFVIMNLYPYNSGHLMVVPNRHTDDFPALSPSELSETMRLLQVSQKALVELAKPHGFNIGMNLGRPAGAGIEGHLHWHIVPRWNGDTNFMPTVADVKLVSEDMDKQWESLQKIFQGLLG
jgi:ATP adenylyltransferase